MNHRLNRRFKFQDRLRLVASILALPLGIWSCAGESKKPDEVVSDTTKDQGSKVKEDASVSSERNTFTNSWSNNSLTSQTISAAKAEQLVETLPLNSKEKRTLEGRLSAERLAKKSMGAALATAKRIAEVEMDKGAERDIPADVKLDLALAAINNKNFALAEYYFADLFDSKNARIKAAALNAVGVIALRDSRVPEAVSYFKEALKAVGNYKPALLNLGFAALKGGDLETAKRALNSLQDDWFVQYGLISVARLEGQDSRADDLCDKVLKKEPGHKAALFNCGLQEFQAKRNFAKARELMEKSGKAKGGDASWDEKTFRMIAEVNTDEGMAKQEGAKKKAAEAAKDKAAKDKKPGEGGAAQSDGKAAPQNGAKPAASSGGK